MTAAEKRAKDMIAKLSTAEVVKQFELTEAMDTTIQVTTVRGWLMDELEKRDADAFDRWMDSEDDSPRAFFAA